MLRIPFLANIFRGASQPAKTLANEVGARGAEKAMQLLGAVGYSAEFPIERHPRDAKMLPLGGGTTQIMRNIIARGLLAKG